MTLFDAVTYLERHGKARAELMELTPAELWALYERFHEIEALERAHTVLDYLAALAPSTAKDGGKTLKAHVLELSAQAGQAPYTNDTAEPFSNDE